MTNPNHNQFHGTYNARWLDPETIGKTFVLNDQAFDQLCANENSLVIGPRGSGKTTLLKMLKPSAAQHWMHPSRKHYLEKLNFTAIYIGVDSIWNERMALVAAGSVEYQFMRILQDATFVTHAMMSMIDSLRECMSLQQGVDPSINKFRISISESTEGALSAELAKRWLLDIPLNSVLAISFALLDRISEIDNIYFNATNILKNFDLQKLGQIKFLSLNFVSCCSAFVETVNSLSKDAHRIWALCVDETEILSSSFQTSLISAMRSTREQRLRFKLSISPFSPLPLVPRAATAPMGGNDFTRIPLTYHNKQYAIKFGRKILSSMLQGANLADDPEKFFGKSDLDREEVSSAVRRYEQGGANYLTMKELEKSDTAFSNYLRKKNIVLDNLAGKSDDDLAEIRKLIQVVNIRRIFGKNQQFTVGGNTILRSSSKKRVSDFYTGVDSLVTMCEGNPRWMIGMFRPLISGLRYRRNVPRTAQATSVADNVARFLSLLTTIPLGEEDRKQKSVVSLINTIGYSFFNGVIDQNFRSEPSLTFVVDKGVPKATLDAVGAALNQGAFVFIPTKDFDSCDGDILGRRFRLSYLLCSRYKLPLTYGGKTDLSTIRSMYNREKQLASDQQITMTELFE